MRPVSEYSETDFYLNEPALFTPASNLIDWEFKRLMMKFW